jgi:hypothetical protein
MAKDIQDVTPVTEPTPQPAVNATQTIEQNAYVPTYKIKPEFKQAVLQCIGDRPFNEIAGLIQAINVETMDHTTLTQIINAMGQFPFIRVEKFMQSINQYVEQVIED